MLLAGTTPLNAAKRSNKLNLFKKFLKYIWYTRQYGSCAGCIEQRGRFPGWTNRQHAGDIWTFSEFQRTLKFDDLAISRHPSSIQKRKLISCVQCASWSSAARVTQAANSVRCVGWRLWPCIGESGVLATTSAVACDTTFLLDMSTAYYSNNLLDFGAD